MFPENQRPHRDCSVTFGLLLFCFSFKEDPNPCLVSGYEIAFKCQSWHHWTCPSIFSFSTFLTIVPVLAISQWLPQGTPHYSTSTLGVNVFGHGEFVLFYLAWDFVSLLLGFLYPGDFFFFHTYVPIRCCWFKPWTPGKAILSVPNPGSGSTAFGHGCSEFGTV